MSDTAYCRYILRPISTRISYFIYSTFGEVNPNVITAIGLIIGISGELFLLTGKPILGVSLLITWTIFDGLDGELARFLNRTSAHGAYLDNVVDHLILVGLLYTAGILSEDLIGPETVILGLSASVLFLLSRLVVALRAENVLKADLKKGGDLHEEINNVSSGILLTLGKMLKFVYELFIRNYNMVNAYSIAFILSYYFDLVEALWVVLSLYVFVLAGTTIGLTIGFYIELKES